jgi:hypothetical protein
VRALFTGSTHGKKVTVEHEVARYASGLRLKSTIDQVSLELGPSEFRGVQMHTLKRGRPQVGIAPRPTKLGVA